MACCKGILDAVYENFLYVDEIGIFLKRKKQLMPIVFCPFCGKKLWLSNFDDIKPQEWHEPTAAQFVTPNKR
jgi:hypothetical protein